MKYLSMLCFLPGIIIIGLVIMNIMWEVIDDHKVLDLVLAGVVSLSMTVLPFIGIYLLS